MDINRLILGSIVAIVIAYILVSMIYEGNDNWFEKNEMKLKKTITYTIIVFAVMLSYITFCNITSMILNYHSVTENKIIVLLLDVMKSILLFMGIRIADKIVIKLKMNIEEKGEKKEIIFCALISAVIVMFFCGNSSSQVIISVILGFYISLDELIEDKKLKDIEICFFIKSLRKNLAINVISLLCLFILFFLCNNVSDIECLIWGMLFVSFALMFSKIKLNLNHKYHSETMKKM